MSKTIGLDLSKFCNGCGQVKSTIDYHYRTLPSGLIIPRAHCKVCTRKKNNANYLQTVPKAFARSAARRAKKLQAMPKWLTSAHKSHIEAYYETAKALSVQFGQQLDVDHIVPLQGKNVCGLHVPWNLQIMAHEANLSKSNKVGAA